MAAPHPALGLLGHELAQRRGLRVVDQAHVPAAGQLARVDLVVAPPGRPLLLVEVLGRALQRVVHQLGRVEELFAAVDHLPLAVEPDVAHQRHERVQDLRDAAAERGRGDVHHALALQRLRQLADFGDQLAPADVRVVGERLVGDGDGLEHAAARYLTGAWTRGIARCALRAAARRQPAVPRGSRPADYGLGACSTGACTERPSCRFLFALAVAAFSLGARPRRSPRRSRPTPSKAHPRSPNCRAWPRRFPTRRPGSAGDERPGTLRRAASSKGSGGTAGGGFSVRTYHFARADDRRRTLAEHGRRPAPRLDQRRADPDPRPPRRRGARDREAELSGTAALLELARVFAARETKRTIVLASTSGGSGGDAGAAQLAGEPRARRRGGRERGHGRSTRRSCWATSPARARARRSSCPTPTALGSPRCSCSARSAEAITPGARAPTPARRACSDSSRTSPSRWPRRTGRAQRRRASRPCWCRSPANAGPPPAARPVSAERLEGFGRAVLSAVDALDTAPGHLRSDAERGCCCSTRRCRRGRCGCSCSRCCSRRSPPPPTASRACAAGACPSGAGRCGRSAARCRSSAARCSPTCSGGSGSSARRPPCRSCRARCPSTARAATAVVAVALTFALPWLLVGLLVRRLGWGVRPDPEVARPVAAAGAASRPRPASRGSAIRSPRCSRCRRCTCGCCSPRRSAWDRGPPAARLAGARRAGPAAARAAGPRSTPTSSGWGSGESAWMARAAARRRARRARRGDPVEPRARLRRRRRDARRQGARGRVLAPQRADAARGHDPRPAVVRRPGIAWWYGVGSATIGERCPSSCSHRSARRGSSHRPGSAAHRARALRAVWRSLLILAGALALLDAVVTLLWQEPISALYATIRQDHLSGALVQVEHAAPTPRRASGAREPARRARANRVPRRRARTPRRRRQRGGAHRDPARRRELRGGQRHRHRRPQERTRASTRKRASPGSPGRPRSPGTARPTWRRSATSTTARAGQPHPAVDALRALHLHGHRPARGRAHRRRRGGRRTSATAAWCCPRARRCSAPKNACSSTRG